MASLALDSSRIPCILNGITHNTYTVFGNTLDMALARKGRNWFVYYRDNGKIKWRSLGTDDKTTAERHADAIMAQVREIRQLRRLANAFPQPLAIYRPPLAEFTSPSSVLSAIPSNVGTISGKSRFQMKDLYAVAERHRKMSPSNFGIWTSYLERCGLTYADEATPQNAQAYMDAHYGDKSAKTYNNVRCALDIIFRAALVEAGLQSSPFEKLLPRRLEDVEHHRAFTKEETSRILDALDTGHDYWKCLTMISLCTGLRLESCRRLCPSMIADNLITIMPGKTARFGRAVQIPLIAELKSYLGSIARLLKGDTSPYCSAFQIENRWSKREWFFQGLLNSLGIRDTDEGTVSFHSLRVTFVTRLSEQGVEDRVIRGIVGHASQQMTDLYNHDSESAVRAMNGVKMV